MSFFHLDLSIICATDSITDVILNECFNNNNVLNFIRYLPTKGTFLSMPKSLENQHT